MTKWRQKLKEKEELAKIRAVLRVKVKNSQDLEKLLQQDYFKTEVFVSYQRLGRQVLETVLYERYTFGPNLQKKIRENKTSAKLAAVLEKLGIIPFVKLEDPAQPLNETEKEALYEALVGFIHVDQKPGQAVEFVRRTFPP